MTTWLRRWWCAPRPSTSPTVRQPRLALETMEGRNMPAALTSAGVALVGYDAAGDATVELVNAATNAPIIPAFQPFPGFHGAITAVSGDLTGNGVPDLIVEAQGAGGYVAVFDGATGGEVSGQFLFPGYNGPVSVGVGDITGAGYDDILVSASLPGLPTGAIDGRSGALLTAFLALPGCTAPTSVTGVDLYGNGHDEIAVGVGGAVGVFSANGGLLGAVFPFPGSTGPVSVAGGDVNGAGVGDLVVGSGPGSPAEVKVYSGAGLGLIEDFQPFNATVPTGINVQVAVGYDGAPDIFVSLQGGPPVLLGFYNSAVTPSGQSAGCGVGVGSGTSSGSDSGSSGDVLSSSNNNNSPPPYTGDPGSSSSPYTGGGDSGGDDSGGDDSGGDDSGGDDSGGDDSGGDDSGGDDSGDDNDN